MSESEQQTSESPLLSERGATTISDTVVSSIAGMAAQEVEGVHMGGGGSRAASGVLGSITGSESKTSGISVEVGRTETAIDLKMGIEYNKNILQTVEEVRRRITDRVQNMTGLRIKELNATITDITFPGKEERQRLGSGSATSTRDDSTEDSSEAATDTAPAAQTPPESEPEASEHDTAQAETTQAETTQAETTQVETPSRTDTEASGETEEEVSAEDRPPEESETTEVRAEERTTVERSTDETSETSETTEVRAETETPEDDAEARMRRRAEERARRRRSTEDN